MDVDESRGMVSETEKEWSKGDVMRGFELPLSDLVLWIEWISGPDSLPGRQIYSWPWW